jgi:hypothetical protein
MTREEFYSLPNDVRYEYDFHLFHLEHPLKGYLIQTDALREEYRILSRGDLKKHRDDNIPLEKLGREVRLKNISSYNLHKTIERTFRSVSLPSSLPKKMVIFGAGASHDYIHNTSGQKLKHAPPLTAHLFEDGYDPILKDFPHARNLSSEILIHAGGVEDYFQRKWDRIGRYTDTLLFRQLLNTQYYIYALFRQISHRHADERKNNYVNLTRWAYEYAGSNDQHVLFVTFNYDTILDNSLQSTCDYSFEHIDDYVNFENRHILLFKPHGSCNWGRKFRNTIPLDKNRSDRTFTLSSFATELFKMQYGMPDIMKHLNEEITLHPITDQESIFNMNVGEWVFPHILLPYKDKDEFAMPSHHYQVLSSMLESVEEILIVGWKGSEMEFQKLLRQRLGEKKLKISVVTNTSEDIAVAYKDILPNADWRFYKGGFSQYITKNGNSFFAVD